MFPIQVTQQQEQEDDVSDVDSEQLEMDMLEELWNGNPDFKAKADELKKASIAKEKAGRAYGIIHKKALAEFKTQTAATVQILKGTAKQTYNSLIQSLEYKAKQKSYAVVMRKFSSLVEQVNSSRWELRRFLRRKGYNYGPFYRSRYSSYHIQREFMIKLV